MSRKKVTVGYKYYLGVDFKWCHAPIDAFRTFYIDERKAWSGAVQNGSVTIDKTKLFGEYEGGVKGTLDILDGNDGQVQNDYLVARLGTGVPAYKGVTSTVLRQMYLGNSPYMKTWTADITRIHRRLLNGTAIVQWEDAYAAVPPYTDNEEGYSSITAAFGATLEPQQILIQIDLSSDANGYRGNNFSIIGGGQSLPATKASVINFLNFLKDRANWDAGAIDLGIAYFRATNGAANVNNRAVIFPDFIREGEIVEAPQRGVKTKIGLTKADIPELIEWVQGLVVYPDTRAHTSANIVNNAVDFFGGIASGAKYRVHYLYSTLQFEEAISTTSTNVGNLNGQLNNGLATTQAGKIAFVPSGVTVNTTGLPPHRYWYGYTDSGYITAADGWYEVPECDTGITHSSTWGAQWEVGPIIPASGLASACTVPAGWGLDDDGMTAPSGLSYYVLTTYDPSGLYIGWKTFKGWVRTSGDGTFNYKWTDKQGGESITPPKYNASTSTNYNDAQNLNDYLKYMIYTSDVDAGIDMNPAHIIRECLTDQQWGLGIPETEIDDASFLAAAISLFNERFGLSMAWNKQTEVEDFIKTILNHIDAVLYVRRDTGKWFLKLVRDDYDPETIPNFTDDDVISWDQITRKTEAELVNSVTIKFNSRLLRGPASLTVNNLAQQQQLGTVIPATVEYPAIWQPSLASVVAERDLRSLSSATISGSIKVSRKAATLYPADTFRLTSARYGLSGEVMRVVEIDLGDGRENAVYIKFVQDVFALGDTILTSGGNSEWDDVISEALPVENRVVEEEDYRTFVRRLGEQDAASTISYEPDLGYIMAFGEAPSSDALDADVLYNSGGGWELDQFAGFCGTATLTNDATRSPLDNVWPLSNVNGLEFVAVNSLAYVAGEIVRIDAVDLLTNTITVGRGCVDTPPEAKIAGTKIYFYEDELLEPSKQFIAGEVVDVKLLTNSGLGQLAQEYAPTDTITFANRITRPYPVGNFKINDSYEDTVYTGTLNLTWAHRDRTLQTGDVTEDHSAGNIGPEAGVSYTVKGEQYDLDNAFVSTLFSIPVSTATSYSLNTATYPMTTSGYVKISVEVSRGGLTNRKSAYINCYTDLTLADISGIAWYDANDLASMFQNADGTGAVTTDNDPVGRINNKLGDFL